MHDTPIIIDTSRLAPFEPVAPGPTELALAGPAVVGGWTRVRPTDVLALSGGAPAPASDEAQQTAKLRAMYGLPPRPTAPVPTTAAESRTMTELRALYGLRRK